MQKSFLFLFGFICCLVACSNDKEDELILHKPPFDKLTDSIQLAPENAELFYRRGLLLFQNEEMAYAQNDLRQAWSLSSNETYALGLANILAQKNADSAIIFLQSALQKLPQSIALQISLARGYQQKKEYEKALMICNNIISQYQNQLDALILKSKILQAQNKKEEALSTMEQAYRYSPFDRELVYDLAFLYAETKNKNALSITDSLIKTDTLEKHAEPYYFKGVYFQNIGNNAEAITQFNEAIRQDYYFLDAYMEKGQILYNQKNYVEARKTFQLASTVSPTFADAYYWLGKSDEAQGNNTEAKLNYQRAYGLDKSLTEAKTAADKL
ncbi:MAG: tetratricopeptide repeat protein [Bacteroidota bacterium]|nr:tetratricopeptide repeat protein [Bacteroidota bacterium]